MQAVFADWRSRFALLVAVAAAIAYVFLPHELRAYVDKPLIAAAIAGAAVGWLTFRWVPALAAAALVFVVMLGLTTKIYAGKHWIAQSAHHGWLTGR